MHIWKISQSVNDGYDTYDSAIVYSRTENGARSVHPNPNWEDYASYIDTDPSSDDNILERMYYWNHSWAPIADVVVEYIGEIYDLAGDNIKPGVILASFNAG